MSALHSLFHYKATVIKVVDGDTIDLMVSLGFDTSVKGRFRLVGVNTPESYGASACPEGVAAKAFTTAALPVGAEVVVVTSKDKKEKYGRYLAEVYKLEKNGVVSEKSVNQMLVESGNARPYSGVGSVL